MLAIEKWNYSQQVCIPRCTHLGWEADLLVLQPSGFLEEAEIKTNIPDLKRDFTDKIEKHRSISRGQSPLKRFWYAFPDEIKDKAMPLIPEYAGAISIVGGRWPKVRVLKPAPALANPRKVDMEERCTLLRLGYLRFWSIEHMV